ncbi:HAD family hydrolase [Xenorhabdus szentirmaii]|uniref:HAD family hydrolase n=1 Tax=Xenorhabdus szentirmaii TaxID=290112 RepID=UPI0019CBD294|nr:HAD family phosphatase [Xenorhabdus sp. 38]MBD2779945.1 HAD family phosphatase [Xenorhabdus sp. 38]
MLKAIIFDLDGVIVDTEYLDFSFQKEFILKLGGKPRSDQTFSVLIGKSYNDLHREISQFLDNKYTIHEIEKRLTDFTSLKYQSVDYKAVFRKNTLDIIKFAKNNHIKLAVASSSPKQHIIKILTACNIVNDFDIITSGEEFIQSKPNPEIYTHTLNLLNVLPQDAIAIEDSYFGILSAKTAGLRVIAFEETRMPIDQSMADFVSKDMLGVLNRIRKNAQI